MKWKKNKLKGREGKTDQGPARWLEQCNRALRVSWPAMSRWNRKRPSHKQIQARIPYLNQIKDVPLAYSVYIWQKEKKSMLNFPIRFSYKYLLMGGGDWLYSLEFPTTPANNSQPNTPAHPLFLFQLSFRGVTWLPNSRCTCAVVASFLVLF